MIETAKTAKTRTKPRPSKPGRLSAEQAAELPDRLLDAALGLFTERGYADTTMEQIAKKAIASTKTIYSRYANKAEILRAVMMRMMERTLARHSAEIPGDPTQIDPLVFLSSLGRQIGSQISGDAAALNQLALAESRRFPEFVTLYKTVIERGTGLIRHALEQWQKDGRLPRLDDPERAAALCLAMLIDPVRIRSAVGDAMSQGELSEHVTYAAALFLRGCGYKQA